MDEDIQAPKQAAGGLDRLRHRGLIGHVDANKPLGARSSGNHCAYLGVQVQADHAGALSGQGSHQAFTHAAGPPGDDDATAFEFTDGHGVGAFIAVV